MILHLSASYENDDEAKKLPGDDFRKLFFMKFVC